MRLKADLALVLMCVFWGGTFVIVKEALGDVSTLLFLTLRFGLAAIILIALGGKPFRLPGAIVGIFLFLGYFLQTQGLRWTTASKSAFITGLAVVLVPLGYAMISRRSPGWEAILGALLAVAGVALLTDVLTNMGVSTSINRGDIWTLGCAIAFAIHILLVSHYSPRMRALDLAASQTLSATLLGTVCFPWATAVSFRSSPRMWIAVVTTGVLCTALGFTVQAWAQRFTTATHAALIYSSEPVFAWITSAIVLKERLGYRGMVGSLLILAGIVSSGRRQ